MDDNISAGIGDMGRVFGLWGNGGGKSPWGTGGTAGSVGENRVDWNDNCDSNGGMGGVVFEVS